MLLSPLPSRASLSLFLLVILSAAKNPRILPLLLLLLSPLLFLLSSPKGICFCLYSLRQPQQKRVRPILRALREGWDVTSPPAGFCFPPKTRHFDRSRSHRERRSGEIRFSTSVAHQPRSKTIKSSTKTTRFTTFYPRFSSQEITFSAPNLQKNPPENRSYREITRNSPQSTTTHYKTRRLVLSTAKWSVLSY